MEQDLKQNIKTYKLTQPQMRIYYEEKIYQNSSMHNIGGLVHFYSKINIEALSKAINIFIKNNDSLRIRIIEHNDVPLQYFEEYVDYKIDMIDFSGYEDNTIELMKWMQYQASKPFKLIENKLYKFAIYKLSENEYGFLIKLHHIISDGWSVSILTEQIHDLYKKIMNQKEIIVENNYSYIDFINSEEVYLNSEKFNKNKLFWNDKYATLPPNNIFDNSYNVKGKRKNYCFNEQETKILKRFCDDNKLSVNCFLIAIYAIYLYKISGNEDLSIGIPVYNRYGKQEKNTFGMFTSTMAFRIIIDKEKAFKDFCKDISREFKRSLVNQRYPYNVLVKDLNLKTKTTNELFSVSLNYYNTKHKNEANGVKIKNIEFYNGEQSYAIQVIFREWTDDNILTLDIDYKTDLFTDVEIDNMYSYLKNIINTTINNPLISVKSINLLSKDEEKLLLIKNESSNDYIKTTLIDSFKYILRDNKDRIAVKDRDRLYTYNEIDELSNRMMDYLNKSNIANNDIVPIVTKNSVDTIIAILAVLKSGAAFLPIDHKTPNERLKYILRDCNAKLIISNIDLDLSEELDLKILDVRYFNYKEFIDNSEITIKSLDDLSYVIYTSGSTGNPKGVMIQERGIVNYINWAIKNYLKTDKEAFPLFTSLSFDLTITSILTPLLSGQKIIIYGENEELEYPLYQILKDNEATIVKLTPSQFSLIKDRDLSNSSIHTFILGGENLKVELAKTIYENSNRKVNIFNEYGPTECVVGCMIHKYNYIEDKGISVPIGEAIDNQQVFVLDENLNLLPKGIVGELYVSGVGIAKGYIGNKQKTEESFIKNPFTCGIMYKTNDLVKRIDDDKLVYIGRKDSQVKINGYRIELEEIENQLMKLDYVTDAVVIDSEIKKDSKILLAYYVADKEISENDINNLSNYLPHYMIPKYFKKIKEIPLTVNGKVNYSLLPPINKDANTKRNEQINNIVSKTEKEYLDIIKDVLNVKEISIYDDYFYLGGDSIKAIQISSKFCDKGYKLTTKTILTSKTFKDMFEQIEPIVSVERDKEYVYGEIPNTPIYEWFKEQDFKDKNWYNQTIMLDLTKKFSKEVVEEVFNKLIMHHDELRINVNKTNGNLFYNPKYLTKKFEINEYNFIDFKENEIKEVIKNIHKNECEEFDIFNNYLIKVSLINFNNNKQKLLIVIHHLIIDGISWRVLLEDLSDLLSRKQINYKNSDSYKKYAEEISTYEPLNEELLYWKEVTKNNFCIYTNESEKSEIIEECINYSESITNKLKGICSKEMISLEEMLIACFATSLSNVTSQDNILLELEGHGRNELTDKININRTIGWFTSIYPVNFTISNECAINNLSEIKKKLNNSYNKGVSFPVLAFLQKRLEYSSKDKIRFNFLGEFDFEYSKDFTIDNTVKFKCSNNDLSCIIEVNCLIIDKCLHFELKYNKNKIDSTIIAQIIINLKFNIEQFINNCSDQKNELINYSDFETIDLSYEEIDSLFD